MNTTTTPAGEKKPRLTTSAMIASIASEFKTTRQTIMRAREAGLKLQILT